MEEALLKGKEINPLLIVEPESLRHVSSLFNFINTKIEKLFPSFKYALNNLNYFDTDAYFTAALLSALLTAIIATPIFYFYLKSSSPTTPLNTITLKSVILGVLLFAITYFFHLFFPTIRAKTFANEIDKNLLYVLKDMLIELKSGATLYQVLVNISNSNYGLVSRQILYAVKLTNAGMPLDQALKKLATKTQSENFRRILWQIITALQSGAYLEPVLTSALKVAEVNEEEKIMKYSESMNFIVLLYMLVSASIPAIIVPFLMILILFIPITVSANMILLIFAALLLIQLALIIYVGSARPGALS
jgi:flagellar protein FlaJ